MQSLNSLSALFQFNSHPERGLCYCLALWILGLLPGDTSTSPGSMLKVLHGTVQLSSLKITSWRTGFQQPESGCSLKSFLLWLWLGLVHSQLLWAITNNIGCLENHKGLKNNQELGNGWIWILPYIATARTRLGEVAISFNEQRLSWRVKQNEETEGYAPNKSTR